MVFAIHKSTMITTLIFLLLCPLSSPATFSQPSVLDNRFGARVIKSPADPNLQFYVTVPVSGTHLEHFATVSAQIWFDGTWSETESLVTSLIFQEHCKPSQSQSVTIYDIGAHVGFYTLLSLVHGCRAHAVEVNPHFVDLLRLSLQFNNLDPATLKIHQKLIGDETHHSTFNGKSANPTWQTDGGDKFPTMSIDDIDPEGGPILFMKLDIEGTELIGLSSATNVLNRLRFLMVEVTVFAGQQNPDAKAAQQLEAAQTLALLRASNFRLFRCDNDETKLLANLVDARDDYELTTLEDFLEFVEFQKLHCIKHDRFHCQIDVFGHKNDEVWPESIVNHIPELEDKGDNGKSNSNSNSNSQLGSATEIFRVRGGNDFEKTWPPIFIDNNSKIKFSVGVDAKAYDIVVERSEQGVQHFIRVLCDAVNLDVVGCSYMVEVLEQLLVKNEL